MIWKDTNRSETGYRVERKTTRGDDDWTSVADLPAGTKAFVDKRLTRNWEYDYRVVSINAKGQTLGAMITVKTLRAPQVGSAGSIHLNRMKWEKATNGLGKPELNMANGGAESGDGKLMSIDGQGYYRGIGVKAESAIKFRLDGKYKTFVSDIGLDDQSKGKGSVRFQVWADGKKLFDSGEVRGTAKARTITVPVQGKQELWLVVTDAGNGNAHDYANWANARLAA
jgi:alpha-galactosidase